MNAQEWNTLGQYLTDSFQVKSELFTDIVIQGLEKNKAFERKKVQDLLASIIDGRIFDQLKELARNSDTYEPFVIIEGYGFFDFGSKQWISLKTYFEDHPDREIGFYKTMAAFKAFGVGTIWTTDASGTARYLVAEEKSLGSPKEKREFPERAGMKKSWTLQEKKKYVLEAFGAETAKALLEAFPTIADICALKEMDKDKALELLSDVKLPNSGRRLGVKAQEILPVLVE